eukprot:CCRYP_013061-RA/>CCRYP_013061-RA protein AED:0.38 eAED:1.00 QI:0/0/0/1/0/0/2/0/95
MYIINSTSRLSIILPFISSMMLPMAPMLLLLQCQCCWQLKHCHCSIYEWLGLCELSCQLGLQVTVTIHALHSCEYITMSTVLSEILTPSQSYLRI